MGQCVGRSIFTVLVIFSVFSNAVIARTLTLTHADSTAHCLQIVTTSLKTTTHSPNQTSDPCCDNKNATSIAAKLLCDTPALSDGHNEKESSNCCNHDDCNTKQPQAALLTAFTFSTATPQSLTFPQAIMAPVHFSETQLRPPLV